MTAWMVSASLATVLLGLAAAWAERVVLPRGIPTRWLWVASLSGGLLLPGVAWIGGWNGWVGATLAAGARPALPGAPRSPDLWSRLLSELAPWLPRLDSVVAVAWPVASALLLVLLLGGMLWVGRARRRWPRLVIDGEEVLMAPDFGPAVIGLLRPEIVLPRRAIEMDRVDVRIALTHEAEHRASFDPLLLFGGAVAVALVPWNAGAWWIARRLRQAIELDCDRRTLATGVPPVRYGATLLAFVRRSTPLPVPGASFGRPRLLIERRLLAMTTHARPKPVPALAGILALAFSGVVIACEAPAPTATAPPGELPDAAAVTGVDPRAQSERDVARDPALRVTREAEGWRRVVSGELPADVRIFVNDLAFEGSLDELDPDRVERIEVHRGETVRTVRITLK